ncbi:ADP-ribose 1''-phosphate phosphatase [Trichophyton rubrum]|uniref:ADP-ribose 1''-phosphate phosphatase n=1 Tax=Trichophyton rubrum TaxID=5551 RepID=A0A178F798_TRIRU|nr:ADP-ribose 1''-phosphate phosphatase [Trichophyton rubrum]
MTLKTICWCLDLLANPQTGLCPANDTEIGDDTKNATQRVTKLPEGTALVIPPQPGDYGTQGFHISTARGGGRGRGRAWHYAAGKRNPPNEIIENTATALADLKRQIDGGVADTDNALRDAELWSCRINAGLFGVDWEQSKSIMAESMLNIKIVSPPPE